MSTTLTSTISLPKHDTPSSSIMLPSNDSDGSSRMVRFDNQCTLIPDSSKRPKGLSKSYSLPLWKKRPSHTSDYETEVASTSSRVSPSTEETHIVFKVPIPRFISRSPSRGRSTSASPPAQPLSPCLVYRSPSSSPSMVPLKPMRRTSLPVSTKRKDDALTVPLRPCCDDCVSITEECLKEGEEWQEKFSRGARRRRSASLDNGDTRGSSSSPTRHTNGFAALTVNTSDLSIIANSRYKSPAFSITVDEVDKRRKSLEYVEDEDTKRFRSHSSTPVIHSPHAPYSASYLLAHGQHEKEPSSSSTSSSLSSELSPHDIPPRRPKSSPIQEEDEDQLFPLPSPRRSPNNSPLPSLNTSPSPSINASPVPSPNTSTSCLPPSAGLSASRENILQGFLGSEGILGHSLSRKETTTRSPPSPKPKLSSLFISTHTHTSSVPSQSPTSSQLSPIQSNGSDLALPQSVSTARPLPIPPSRPRDVAPSASTSFPTSMSPLSKSSVSPTKTPRRPSFSLPAIKDALKGAGADVLKGVSSMGGGGSVVGSV